MQQPSQVLFGVILLVGIMIAFYAIILITNSVYGWPWRQQINEAAETPNEENAMRGISNEDLKKIPILPYSIKNKQKDEYHGLSFREDQTQCPVCLTELQEGELVRLLPSCKHAFHINCIDCWFLEHTTCPLCRLVPKVSQRLRFSSCSLNSISGLSNNSAPLPSGIEERQPTSARLAPPWLSLLFPNRKPKPPFLPIEIGRSMSV